MSSFPSTPTSVPSSSSSRAPLEAQIMLLLNGALKIDETLKNRHSRTTEYTLTELNFLHRKYVEAVDKSLKLMKSHEQFIHQSLKQGLRERIKVSTS